MKIDILICNDQNSFTTYKKTKNFPKCCRNTIVQLHNLCSAVKSRQQLLICKQNSQTWLNSMPKLHKIERNYGVEFRTLYLIPETIPQMSLKLILKILCILQLRQAEHIVFSSYKVGMKKHFCINTSFCKSLFSN